MDGCIFKYLSPIPTNIFSFFSTSSYTRIFLYPGVSMYILVCENYLFCDQFPEVFLPLSSTDSTPKGPTTILLYFPVLLLKLPRMMSFVEPPTTMILFSEEFICG